MFIQAKLLFSSWGPQKRNVNTEHIKIVSAWCQVMSNFVHLSKAFNALNFTVIKSWSFQLILNQCGRNVTSSDDEMIQVQRITNIFRHPCLWDRQEVPARPSLISCSGGLAQSSRGFALPCCSFQLWLNGHPVPLSLTVTYQHAMLKHHSFWMYSKSTI